MAVRGKWHVSNIPAAPQDGNPAWFGVSTTLVPRYNHTNQDPSASCLQPSSTPHCASHLAIPNQYNEGIKGVILNSAHTSTKVQPKLQNASAGEKPSSKSNGGKMMLAAGTRGKEGQP